MKTIQTLNFVKLAVCAVLVVGLNASALASCGDSLSAMAAAATAFGSQARTAQPTPQSSKGNTSGTSIVGFWHVQFTVGGNLIQEAYQIWNFGGTEVHNPNVDPRGGDVCLGAWKETATPGTFKLAHRVWNYDVNGNFMGTINLGEKVTVGPNGNGQIGTFTLDFYDPTGKFLNEVPGDVKAERVSVE
jgi:hypothetical protein